MALSIDGSPGSASFGGAGPGVVAITTSMADDIILIAVGVEKNATAVQTVTSIDDVAGLIWNFRKAQDETNQQRLELWWAHAPAALTANNITVNISAATDDGILLAFAVNGANLTTPFDVNGSLPAGSVEIATHDPNNVVNTTAAKTMLLGISASRSGASYSGRDGAGYTHIGDAGNFGGSRQITIGAEYKLVTSAQSGVDIDFSFPGLVDAVTIGDALQEASTGITGTLAATESADVVAIVGNRSAFGTLGATEAADVVAAAGYGPATAALAVTESPDVVAIVGVEARTGTLAATEATDHVDFTSGPVDVQALAAVEAPDGVAITGAVRSHPYPIVFVSGS